MTNPSSHRVTYYSHRLPARVETGRYTAEDGSQIVLESAHATLTSVSQYPHRTVDGRHGERYGVHRAVDADGTEGYVIKTAYVEGQLCVTSTSHRRITVTTYCPTDEWDTPTMFFYLTMEDALVCAGDATAREQEETRLRDMTTQATEAAAAIDGDGEWAWSRAAYEAACAAAGLEPAADDKAQRLAGPGSGVYTIPEYHREHIVWADLARRRAAGVEQELASVDTGAQARADQATGTGPYSRSEYETACAAAGVNALPDEVIPQVTADHYLAPYSPIRDVLGEMRSAAMLGSTRATAAALAGRRERGMTAELAERRARERQALAEQGHEFATQQQVDTILELLAERADTGEGGGFFYGPTDPGGVANMDRASAELYITSLRGEY